MQYEKVSEFVNDVRLVWSNCFAFNDPNSEICDFAADLSYVFEKLMKEKVMSLQTKVSEIKRENIGLLQDMKEVSNVVYDRKKVGLLYFIALNVE